MYLIIQLNNKYATKYPFSRNDAFMYMTMFMSIYNSTINVLQDVFSHGIKKYT